MNHLLRRVLLIAVALVVCQPALPCREAPPREIALPATEVEDVFFAYVVGILLTDSALDLDGAELIEMFPEFADGGGNVPFDEILRVTRSSSPAATVTLLLNNPLDYPVPVDILGYHPGTVLSSGQLVFTEEEYVSELPGFGTIRLEWLDSGSLRIDFVTWLDLLLGGWVDDVDTRVLVALEYEDHWYALMAGNTPRDGWITGVYDLRSSRIVVRPARGLRDFGKELEQLALERREHAVGERQ